MNSEIKNNLKELGFQENETKVYIALTVLGEAKAAQIAKKADLPRTTVISILNRLAENNFITTHHFRGATYYWIESPKTLSSILKYRMETADKLGLLLTDLYREEANFPSVEIYDTKSGIKNQIEKVITGLKKKTIIYTIDTPEAGNYAKIFGGSQENIMSLKKKNDIMTYTLIPHGSFKGIASQKIGNQDIKIKELPASVDFSGSIWIIGNRIFHFSGNPPFLVVIKHDNIVKGVKGLFNFLWQIAEEKN